MAARARGATKSHPFPYFGQGLFAGRKEQILVVVFTQAVPEQARDALRDGAPRVFNRFEWITQRVLHAGHVGAMADAVADAYPRRADDRRFEAHRRDVERWLGALHRAWPVAFVVQVPDAEGGFGPGEWHRVSSLQLGPAGVWAQVEGATPELVPVVLDYWKSAVHALDPKRGRAALDDLSVAAREFLERHGGMPQLETAPPEPSLDEKLAAFRAVRDEPAPIEDAYAELVPGGGDLTDLASELDAADHIDACIEVCEAGVRARVSAWVSLSDRRILALVRGERFAQAREDLPEALVRTDFYSADRLLAAWIRLLERADRREDARSVFHAGLAHISYFKLMARGHGLDAAAYGSRAAAGASKRFAVLYRETIAPAWTPAQLEEDVLQNARHSFEKLKLEDLQLEARAELERRQHERRRALLERGELLQDVALIEAISAPDVGLDQLPALLEAIVRAHRRDALLAELAQWVMGRMEFDLPRADGVLDALVEHGAPADPRQRRKWLRYCGFTIDPLWKRGDFPRARRIIAWLQPWAVEHPVIFHSAACAYVAMNEPEHALEQVRLAVQHGYEDLARLRADEDLAPLRAHAEFQALFR